MAAKPWVNLSLTQTNYVFKYQNELNLKSHNNNNFPTLSTLNLQNKHWTSKRQQFQPRLRKHNLPANIFTCKWGGNIILPISTSHKSRPHVLPWKCVAIEVLWQGLNIASQCNSRERVKQHVARRKRVAWCTWALSRHTTALARAWKDKERFVRWNFP